jgi:hypothetical protein
MHGSFLLSKAAGEKMGDRLSHGCNGEKKVVKAIPRGTFGFEKDMEMNHERTQ